MSLWRQVTHGVRVLAHRESADLDLTDELRHYVEQAAAELTTRGWSSANATRAAMLQIGNLTVARESVRAHGWEHAISTFMTDLRYAVRRLRGSPGFTTVATLTLALGIGASTAIFSAVNPILFESLPYPHADRLAMISDVASTGELLDVTFGTYLELAHRSQRLASIAAMNPWQPTAVGDGEPERLTGQQVGASFFRTLGVTPFIGRDFQVDDDRPNAPRVAILSYELWRRRFASDRAIVGRTVRLDDQELTVVGVMPRDFENVLAPLAEVWTPLRYNTVFSDQSREWGHHLRLVTRLRPGASLDDARAELNRIARTPVPEFARVPWASLDNGLVVTSLQDGITRGIRPVLIAVVVAVLLLVAIVCVNVTNLVLARGAQRSGEFALRAALGAGSPRLIRQVLTESIALALLGGLLGIAVAQLGIRAIVALSPAELPRLGAIRLDGSVFAFALVITTAVGILVGLLPALRAGRIDVHARVLDGSVRVTGGPQRARGVLVVAQVALALVLLVSAGLLFRSIAHVIAVPVGFDSSHLLSMHVQVAGAQFHSDSEIDPRVDSARYLFYTEALDAVRQVPGVTAASFTSLTPLGGGVDVYGVHFEGEPDPKRDGAALRYAVMPGYFDAMRIPLKRGRLLDARDNRDAPRVVLMNESFAARRFAGQDPLGKRLRFGPDEGDWYTVAGIVGDVRQSPLSNGEPDALYVSPMQWHWVDGAMSLIVRGRGDAAALTPVIRRAIWTVNKDQPISRIATMRELVERSISDRHFALILFEAFGLTALLLAAIGIYGVLSGSVTERTREIGVRAALGASRSEIVHMILRRGMTLSLTGVVVGLLAAVLATRVIVSMLFGVSRLDLATYLIVIALLGAASAIACTLPALRAARVDPAITLKAT